MNSRERVPRELDSTERELLLWVLPVDRPGYAEYRRSVERWPVVAPGRRGEGNYILAEPGWIVDAEPPLPQLFAYGVVEREKGTLSVRVRERVGEQIEFEIEGDRLAASPEIRRWTLSDWSPSCPCPCCLTEVREVRMSTSAGQTIELVLCNKDRRIWVFDDRTGVNLLLPVTGFYNELMLQTGVKDPTIAFEPRRLFDSSDAQRDADLIRAFSSYNRHRNKLAIEGSLKIVGQHELNILQRLVGVLSGRSKKAGE